MSLAAWPLLLGWPACAPALEAYDSAEPTSVELLDPLALTPVSGSEDALASHRPDEVDCPAAAWGEEGGGFEVQTGACDYAAFEQPLVAIPAEGDVVEISIWHDTLDAAEQTTGHVAVLLDDRVVWEETVHIPAVSAALDAAVPLDFTPSPDARLGLHLHNHGYNSWRFVRIRLTAP